MENREPQNYLVSNRLPMTVVTNGDRSQSLRRSAGGLVSALSPIHKLPNSWWVGYAGDTSKGKGSLAAELHEERFIPVSLPRKLYSDYYNGLANGGIWPLFHYFPSYCEYIFSEWEAYCEVNRRFCAALVAKAKPGDFIWVHDYHLMLLPGMLRQACRDFKIGYFHHIPFPATEVFRVFPWRNELLEGLCGADVIGFHTLEYARHFINAVSRYVGFETRGDEVHCDGRIIKVGAFPLGIDIETLTTATKTPEHAKRLGEIQKAYADKTLILGLDRLDYTKGIKERLEAFALFLKNNPSLASSVVMLQVSVPSRVDVMQYGNLRSEVERLVGKINGEFGTTTHAPVQYIFKSVDKDELTALYRRADICFITPLRDGLNLVCKEYVALKEDLNGMLILSEFVGAAEEMGEALLVNPYDVRATAAALEAALKMPIEEKRSRMRALRNRVFSFDNTSWSQTFLEAVDEVVGLNQQNASRELDDEEIRNIEMNISQKQRAVLCVDFDALFYADIRKYDFWAHRSRILETLRKFADVDRFVPIVVTGQGREYCNATFEDVHTWLLAENGAFIRAPYENDWTSNASAETFEKIKPEVMRVLNRCLLRVPNSRIEEKDSYLIWNYKRTRSPFAQSFALETAHALNELLAKSLFQCVLGRHGIEVRPVQINKGLSLALVCQKIQFDPNSDLLLTIGDNKTDEDFFRLFGVHNISITIGPPALFSRLTVPDPQILLTLLEQLAQTVQSSLGNSTLESNKDYVSSWNHRKLPDRSLGESERIH